MAHGNKMQCVRRGLLGRGGISGAVLWGTTETIGVRGKLGSCSPRGGWGQKARGQKERVPGRRKGGVSRG